MRTLLYINDTFCSSLEQLRGVVSLNLIPNTPVYEDLLTLQRDGELAQWLAEGSQEEVKLSKMLDRLPTDSTNNELMESLFEIITGESLRVPKPNIFSFLDFKHVNLSIDNTPILLNPIKYKEYRGKFPKNSIEGATSKMYISTEIAIKKIENESFNIQFEGNEQVLKRFRLSLVDKKPGQSITLTYNMQIVENNDFSFKILADDLLIYDIFVSANIELREILQTPSDNNYSYYNEYDDYDLYGSERVG